MDGCGTRKKKSGWHRKRATPSGKAVDASGGPAARTATRAIASKCRATRSAGDSAIGSIAIARKVKRPDQPKANRSAKKTDRGSRRGRRRRREHVPGIAAGRHEAAEAAENLAVAAAAETQAVAEAAAGAEE